MGISLVMNLINSINPSANVRIELLTPSHRDTCLPLYPGRLLDGIRDVLYEPELTKDPF